jgi:hypothetical protein
VDRFLDMLQKRGLEMSLAGSYGHSVAAGFPLMLGFVAGCSARTYELKQSHFILVHNDRYLLLETNGEGPTTRSKSDGEAPGATKDTPVSSYSNWIASSREITWLAQDSRLDTLQGQHIFFVLPFDTVGNDLETVSVFIRAAGHICIVAREARPAPWENP